MKVARYTMLIGLLLAFAGMATLACASEAEPALNEAQMRSIVQEAVAKSAPAPQPQVSAEEIKSMVEEAMPMAPEPVSAAEIKSMVESSMMDMASSQVSAEEIQSMVEKAVSSAAMEGASAQELQALVQSAVSAITADAITSDDVQSAISMAVMESQEGMVTSAEIQSMVENAVSSAAMEGASPQELQAMVQSAVGAITADAITAEDVQAAISMAVMESQEGMVTGKDVEAAVSMAVMESQSQKGMVTGKDVEEAVSMAVMEAQKGMVTSEDVEKAMSSAMMVAAENSLTAEQIEGIVSKALEERAMMEEAPKGTIVFSDLNWTSAQVQNRIAQFIVEHGYGYPTDVIFGGTLPNFVGLQAGDIHVTLEIWLPNQSIGWEKAIEIGDVVSVGTSLVGDWQSTFVVPKYIADANPDLKTPQDLLKPEYQELFSTPDSRGKARLVACVPTWACSQTNSEQIDTYGLADHLHVLTPGDQSAMFAEIFAAYEKQEPWLGYMWGTGDPALKLDLVRLQEEPYTEECWDTGKACAFADSLVLIAVHKSLLPRAPEVIGMLQKWEFSIDLYKSIFQYMDANEDVEPSDAAEWFLNNNKIWERWVTPEAAAAVNAALASGA
jgi:glycine betaine/proline transport system substrate-binding protein